jgi:hypothetical protein
MPITVQEEGDGQTLMLRVRGKLETSDYERFVPEFERLAARQRTLKVLFEMSDFPGFATGAFWKDTRFAQHHFRDIERLAMVGEKTWYQGMVSFCKPFTASTIRYFGRDDAAAARDWLGEA